MAELGSGAVDPAAGDGPAFPNYCPRCGATLTAPRCPTCLLLSQLRHTGAELERWQAQGVLDTETAQSLRADLVTRSQDAIAQAAGRLTRTTSPPIPPQPATARAGAPPQSAAPAPQEPRAPAAPTEWDRFREATGVSWVYAVGVLFLVAGMGWLVVESSRSLWGRWALALATGVLAAAALKGGWYLLERLKLRLGGQALLTTGALLTPAALFAAATALGHLDALTSAAIWSTGAGLSWYAAWRGSLGSQLVLANLLTSLAAFYAALAITGAPAAPGWFGTAAALLALLNLGLDRRRAAGDGDESDELAKAARGSALALLVAGTLAIVPAAWDAELSPWSALCGLLLLSACGAGAAVGYRQPPWLLAAAAYGYGAVLWSDRLGIPPLSPTFGILALLAAEGPARRMEGFRGWLAGAATAALAMRLPYVVPELMEGRIELGTVASAVALTIGYLTAGLAWRERWLVLLGAGLASFTAWVVQTWLGFGATATAALQATAAGLVLLVGEACRDERRQQAASAAWLPLAVGAVAALVQLAVWYGAPFVWTAPDPPPAPDLALAIGTVLLAGLATWAAWRAPDDWTGHAEAATWGLAMLALLLLPGYRAEAGLLAALAGSGLALVASVRKAARFVEAAAWAMLVGAMLTVLRQLAIGPSYELLAASATIAAAAGMVAWHGPHGQFPRLFWQVLATVAAGWAMAALTGLRADCQALGMALVAGVAGRLNRERNEALRITALVLATIAATGALAEPLAVAFWAALLAQLALWDNAGQEPVAAGLATSTWLLAAFVWNVLTPEHVIWPLHAAAAFGLGGLWLASRRPGGMAAGLLIAAVGHGHLGQHWCPSHQPLWFGLFALAACAGAVYAPDESERQQATTIAVGTYVTAAMAAILMDQRLDALVLLLGATAASGWLYQRGRATAVAPVLLANLTAAYLLGRVWEADGTALGLRLALLVLADSGAGYLLSEQKAWRDPLLAIAGLVALVSCPPLLPADRNTVLAAICLGAASFTTAATLDDVRLQDLGAFCFLAALFMVLHDLAEHGRPGLSPYRAIDLWMIPLGIYLLVVVERRAASRPEIRRCGIGLILGSVLISALAAEGVGHDALLLLAVAGSVFYGIAHEDAAVRWVAIGTFATYIQIEVWRQRPEWGKLLLIAMLLAGGAAAIAAGLRQEKEGRG